MSIKLVVLHYLSIYPCNESSLLYFTTCMIKVFVCDFWYIHSDFAIVLFAAKLSFWNVFYLC